MKYQTFLSVLLLVIISSAANAQSDSNGSRQQNQKYSLGNVSTQISLINPKFIIQNVKTNYELQITAGHSFNQRYMLELDLNYQFYNSDNFSHSAGIGAGTSHDDEITNSSFFWKSGTLKSFGQPKTNSVYCKINYSLNWHFLFLQTAVALGNHNYTVPRFSTQLGFMYHF